MSEPLCGNLVAEWRKPFSDKDPESLGGKNNKGTLPGCGAVRREQQGGAGSLPVDTSQGRAAGGT